MTPAGRRPDRRHARRGPGDPAAPRHAADRDRARPAAGSPTNGGRSSTAAIDAGLELHSGLHTFLGDDPELSAAAAIAGVHIIDYRRPPERFETAVGRRHGPGKRVILTVGTDCAIGKMSVALELRNAARPRGTPWRSCPPGRRA